jgi:nicotinamide riboside transporter PnuC
LLCELVECAYAHLPCLLGWEALLHVHLIFQSLPWPSMPLLSWSLYVITNVLIILPSVHPVFAYHRLNPTSAHKSLWYYSFLLWCSLIAHILYPYWENLCWSLWRECPDWVN